MDVDQSNGDEENKEGNYKNLEEKKETDVETNKDDIVYSKFELMKKIGRIGLKVTKLEIDFQYGNFKVNDIEGLDIEAIDQFSSIRANTAVFAGKYYFEVKLMTPGLM